MSEESARPGSVGDVIGDAAPCPVVNWNGKAYRVGRPTPAALAAAELEIARVATAEAKALQEVLPPDEAAEIKAAHRRGLLARTHRVGGPQWQTTFETAAGLVLILWACVVQHHPEVTTDDVGYMFQEATDEALAALLLVAPDFFQMVGTVARLRPDRMEAQTEKIRAAVEQLRADHQARK